MSDRAAQRTAGSGAPTRVLGVAASAILFGHDAAHGRRRRGRYLFNRPLRGAFEITELMLLVLIFAGLPLVSCADEHVTLDFIDRLLGPRGSALLRAARRGRRARPSCSCLAWLVWLKADKIAAYGDTTDVLRIAVRPVRLLHGASWSRLRPASSTSYQGRSRRR